MAAATSSRLAGRAVRLVVATLLTLAVSVPDTEAGRGHGGGSRSGGGSHSGGHKGSHHGKSHGHHHGRGHGHHHARGTVVVGVGPWWGPGWWGGWPGYYDYRYYAPPGYYAPPAAVTEPRVYIERRLETPPLPEPLWYYCESAAAYYPAVQSCPEPWLKVPPSNR